MGKAEWKTLKVLNVLMRFENQFLDTYELCEICNCERKTIYNAIDFLESNGFAIEVIKNGPYPNQYKYRGLYGFSERG